MNSFQNQIRAAHDHCAANRAELLKSEICACVYCQSTFPPSEIRDWIEEIAEGLEHVPESMWTALCPRCPVDAVIGSASGYPVTDARFLKAMHDYWF